MFKFYLCLTCPEQEQIRGGRIKLLSFSLSAAVPPDPVRNIGGAQLYDNIPHAARHPERFLQAKQEEAPLAHD